MKTQIKRKYFLPLSPKDHCPICGSTRFEFTSYSEAGWGTVERHGWCGQCGYFEEQAYGPVLCGHSEPTRRGRKVEGKYFPKNIRKRLRYKRKFEIKYSSNDFILWRNIF